jgi:hypothetical protein
MLDRFAEAKQAEMLAALAEIKKDHLDKYHLYNGIHQVVEKACDFCIPDHTILPERDDLLRYLKRR